MLLTSHAKFMSQFVLIRINYNGNLALKKKKKKKLSISPLKPLEVLHNTSTERWKRLKKEFPFHPISQEPFYCSWRKCGHERVTRCTSVDLQSSCY